jgi:tRNA G18 (ribose-2'-O)-methylase SpoU
MKRGYFGIGIYRPRKEVNLGTLWRSAHAFGASFIFTIGARYQVQASDTTKAHRHVPYFPLLDLGQFFNFIPYGCQLVGVEIVDQARDIKNFVHPERCIYILGPENGSLGKIVLHKCQHVIKIDSRFCLNVSTTGSIVMYDRIIK